MEKLIKFLESDYLGAVLVGGVLGYVIIIILHVYDLYDDLQAWVLGP